MNSNQANYCYKPLIATLYIMITLQLLLGAFSLKSLMEKFSSEFLGTTIQSTVCVQSTDPLERRSLSALQTTP